MTPGKMPKKLFTENQVENLKEIGISIDEQEKLILFVDDAFDKLTKEIYHYEDFYFLFEKIFTYLSNEELFNTKCPHKYLVEGIFEFSETCSSCFGYFSKLISFIFGTELLDEKLHLDRDLALRRNAAFCELLVLKAKNSLMYAKSFDSLYELLIVVILSFSGSFNYNTFIKSVSKCAEHSDRNKVNLYISLFTELNDSPKNINYSCLMEVYFRILKKLEKIFCEKVKDQL